MTDDDFLRAIIPSPEDDGPRLVYADYLEEHGQTDRADFIRVQCQLAKMPAGDERRPALEELERRLLERHQDEWLGSLRPLLAGWVFRRGFLDVVVVPAATYLQDVSLPRPVTVRRVEVDLAGFEVPAAVLELVPESVAYENVLLPIGFRGGRLLLAVEDPLYPGILEKMRFILNREIEPALAPGRQVSDAIHHYYGSPVFAGEEPNLIGCLTSQPAFSPDEVDLGSWDNRSPAARLLARLLALAIGRNAGEVHIEPGPDRIRVRYICDGGPLEGEITPIQPLWPVVNRLRIMAGIWVDDPRDVQAGVIRLSVRHERVEVGVMIRRSGNGPAVVLKFRPPGSAIGSGWNF